MLGYYTGKGLAWKWAEPLGREGGGQCRGRGSENRNKLWKFPRLHYFTNYHTPTCFDIIVLSSGSL